MVENTNRPPKNFFGTWRYLLFWVSSLLSNMGTWMQQIAQPWMVLKLSNSPFWVGLDSFALNVPGLLFTLLGGVLADRVNRQRLILIMQGIQFLCVLALVILLITGLLKVWMIVSISFLVGSTDALSNPSFQTIVPSMVSQRDIPRAISLNSTQYNLSRILGPVIAGIVIARFGAIACFGANAASYFPFLLSIYFIYPRKRVKPTNTPTPTQVRPLDQFQEIRKLVLIRKVRLPLLTSFVANLFCAPLITFTPVLIRNVFHAQVGEFGWAMAALGLGGLFGAGISFINLPKSFDRDRFSAVASVVLGLAVVAVALNHSLQLLSILLVLAGAMLTATNVSVNTFLQEKATNANRGRVASLYQLAIFGGTSLGALITGFSVSQFNISTALVINGTLAFLFQAWLLWQQLRKPASTI
jgi:MFS family permease